MKMIDTALQYHEKGLSVIPVRPDKKPFIPWTEYQSRYATPEEIRAWWQKWPGAMIGIVTGSISGIFVIDCDSEEAYWRIQELLPDTFITCIAKTPRGYHLYLVMPKERIDNAAGILPGVDVRGEGGYIIAPPSMNVEGKYYTWLDGLSILEGDPATVPDALNKSLSLYRAFQGKATPVNNVNNVNNFLKQGTRDSDLFHVGNCLIKGGCKEHIARQVLDILAKNCEPPFPKQEAQRKIDSVLKRVERKDRSIAGEVREWVLSTSGNFLSTDCQHELTLSTRSEVKTMHMALRRLCEGSNPSIVRHGQKRGCYRRIENDIEFMDFLSADTENTVDLTLPLGLSGKTRLFPKAVIVVAGVSGKGKTLFALNTIYENMGRFPIYYFNSEMGPEALKQKLSQFPISIEQWARGMKVVDNWDFFNIADKIQPDAFNVVDYLEPEGEKAFNIHGVISAIIRKLDKGTALITVQKKPGATMGTGGIYSVKAATLALALDWGCLEIVKNRFREADPMPSLKKINFEVHRGFEFVKQGGWYA
jgi:hypothetical protein